MNRKISWESMELDEIELVYEKAEEDPDIAALMEQLETQALTEAKNNIGMLKTDGGAFLTPDQFDGLSESDQETVIRVLGNGGLSALSTEMQTATIRVRLSPLVAQVQACTVFNLLNRFEKLDGAINIRNPKWTLELQVPLGGRKGLFRWEMLIMQLYPWISVREISTTEAAAEVGAPAQSDKAKAETRESPAENAAALNNAATEKEPLAESHESAKAESGSAIRSEQSAPGARDKKSFWKKLFGK